MPRLRIRVEGVVQGVGFRPFVYRLARDLGLGGWVLNRPDGVLMEVEGTEGSTRSFLARLEAEAPAPARIRSVEAERVPEVGDVDFAIRPSGEGDPRPTVPADLALCPACAQEMDDPADRRHGYAFTNCTHCGPRFTIIEGLPYDRPRTSMKGFPLCPDCLAEYRDPGNRRFHAQPVACPVCGPRLILMDAQGEARAEGAAALDQAAEDLRSGRTVALKGLGGFQLMVDATSPEAVARLRARKRREEKPFAVMYPDLDAVRADCRVSEAEAQLLASPAAPILLLVRKGPGSACEGVAPRNPRLGAFLPCTPLHKLLLGRVGGPVVCTSGNLTEEPMCHRDDQALERLGGIADAFLTHDRPIVRPVDDSVLRLDAHGPTLLRRARGYAPLAHPVSHPGPPILALGAHQKSTLCLLDRGQAVVSQHLGDLHTADGAELLERTAEDFLAFFGARPGQVACDLHPDYASTRLAESLARRWGAPLARVQHHHAHVAAVAAEYGLAGPVFGLAWDGTGLGTDGTVWGGEALLVQGRSFARLGHLKPFRLPGGERAAREPARSALGLLASAGVSLGRGEAWFSREDLALLEQSLQRGVNAPWTSSIGRLFDAVAALTGIRASRGYEGQAAMELEFQAQRSGDPGTYPWGFAEGEVRVADPAPLLAALLADLDHGLPPADCARRFHRALADLALVLARRAGKEEVVLSGGCFQNALLVSFTRDALLREGFRPLLPAAFPPNDGAISLGQAWVAAQP